MIKLKYLAHSSFLVQCGSTRLIFDPWLKGPAYARQWYLWPTASDFPSDPDAILISHGHEDHLHIESLMEFDKTVRIFFPFQWRDGLKKYLGAIGFDKVTEAVSFTTYRINDVEITYIGYSLESVIVIEYANEVLVNINDALNSNHETAVSFILKEIQSRWRKIDYFLSGWSGAGYFPNQIRFQNKDDREIGILREQYFANNFCRFVDYLNPKFAIPFAPGFILVRNDNHWINHIKFPRNNIRKYFRELTGKETEIKFIVMFPGDSTENGNTEFVSPLHAIPEEKQYLKAYEYYKDEIEIANRIELFSDEKVDSLISDLNFWMNSNKKIYDVIILRNIFFTIHLTDVEESMYLNIYFDKDEFILTRSEFPFSERQLQINTSGKLLAYTLRKEWGGDILTIGYGLTLDIYDERSLEKNLDIVCVRLITRYPIASDDLMKYPLRALKYYATNPKIASLWLGQKMKLKPYVNKFPFNERDHWLTYNKCDLCAVCKMPEVNIEAFR